jgi:hypothetical protein
MLNGLQGLLRAVENNSETLQVQQLIKEIIF